MQLNIYIRRDEDETRRHIGSASLDELPDIAKAMAELTIEGDGVVPVYQFFDDAVRGVAGVEFCYPDA